VITFWPTLKLIGPKLDPEVADTPLTVTVAFGLVTVGVIEMLVVPFDTETVYDEMLEVKPGLIEPPEVVRPESVATAEPARVTVTV